MSGEEDVREEQISSSDNDGDAEQGEPAENSDASAASETEEEKSSEEEKTGDDEAEKRRRSGFQKRINKLTREKYEALKAAEEARRKAAELEAKISGSGLKEPNPNDFDDYESYLKAHAQWVKEEVKRELAQQQSGQQSTVDPDEIELADRVNNILIDAAARYDDFEEVVVQNTSLPITEEMVRVVSESDQAADILYFLGKNPRIAENLSGLSGIALAREVGKLEATLRSGQPAKSRKQVTKAPAPINPTNDVGPSEVDEDNLSIEEWIERRNRQVFGQ